MSRKGNRLSKYKNFGFDTRSLPAKASNFDFSKKDADKNLANYISPVQLMRLRTDVSMWRDAIAEAERAYYPFRVKMQRIFIDTVLNGHCYSVMERRKDLTLLRDYKICDGKGIESEDLTQMLKDQDWFTYFQGYALDALFFGYSLISLGDIISDELQDVSLVPRWFCSPDRHTVGTFIYSTSGADFREEPYKDWHVYVKTQSDHGVSPAGYGLLYQVALYEIFLRNTLGFNGDFVELYAQPYRVGKTTKTTEVERAELEAAIKNMGSSGWAIIDPQDEIEFLETAMAGTGYKSYESLETRCQKTVSKIILGHADAVDSTPGKLGSGQGGTDGAQQDGSPVAMALADKQSKDGRFMESVINKQLFPKLTVLPGKFKIPDGYHFEYKNDGEEEQFRAREDGSNLITAQIAQTMKSAGLKMDAAYYEKRTGIKTTDAPDPVAPVMPGQKPGQKPMKESVKNKLEKLYS